MANFRYRTKGEIVVTLETSMLIKNAFLYRSKHLISKHLMDKVMYMYILGLVFGVFAGLITTAFSFTCLSGCEALSCFIYVI